MKSIADLAAIFDSCRISGQLCAPPTDESVQRINSHLGIVLPADLVWLARNTRKFGCWFASLDADFRSPSNIVHINRSWRSRSRANRLPVDLVVINIGFDEDLDCLDVSSFDSSTGEYPIQYWAPGVKDGARYDTFRTYLDALVAGWPR